jgi:hypothetical protein
MALLEYPQKFSKDLLSIMGVDIMLDPDLIAKVIETGGTDSGTIVIGHNWISDNSPALRRCEEIARQAWEGKFRKIKEAVSSVMHKLNAQNLLKSFRSMPNLRGAIRSL